MGLFDLRSMRFRVAYSDFVEGSPFDLVRFHACTARHHVLFRRWLCSGSVVWQLDSCLAHTGRVAEPSGWMCVQQSVALNTHSTS